MNQQNENPQNQENMSKEQPKKTSKGSQIFRRHGSITTAIVLAVIFIFLYVIVNVSAFANIFSTILSVCTPIILGVALAYLLNPLLKFYEFKVFKKIKSTRVLRVLSMFMTYITVAAFLTACGFILFPQLVRSVMDLAGKFDSYLDNTVALVNSFLQKLLQNEELHEFLDKGELITAITNFISKSGDLLADVVDYVIQYGSGLVIGIKNAIFALFISIYVLAAKDRLKAQLHKFTAAVFHQKGEKRFYRYLRLCDRTFSGYFVGVIIDSLIVGAITLVTLLIFRMPYPLLVAAIVCITNVIPVFGPFIGAIPSFFIIFIVSPYKAFIFLILILIIQQLDGNVIVPRVLGNSTGVSTLGVMVSIIVMGDLFGVVGMVIAVPLFAVITAVVKEFVEAKLRKKNLPTDTAEFYEADSLVDPHEVHETVTQRLFRGIGRTFSRIFRRKKGSKPKDAESSKEENNNEDNSKGKDQK